MKSITLIFSLWCVWLPALSASISIVQPPIWDADEMGGVISLELDWLTVEPGFGGPAFETRALGGSFPGPTIAVSAGTTLHVKFTNNLIRQDSAKLTSEGSSRRNMFNDPDTGNLHFHGAHVTSVLPGDDTTVAVKPGDSYDYLIPFMENHAPGLHWIHPHHHGSTSLHLGGGAACALIVKDPPGFLPAQVADAEEVILVMQDMAIQTLSDITQYAGDSKFRDSLTKLIDADVPGHRDMNHQFVTVNGLFEPTLNVVQGKWQRWRILYAGWQDLALNLEKRDDEAGCEFQLLAKDGVYLNDYPRVIHVLPVPPGGRADIMVRCNKVGSTKIRALSRLAMTIIASENENENEADADLVPWTPEMRPDYLQDLNNAPATPGCSCTTEMRGYDDRSYVNFESYVPGNYFLHTSYLGATVERSLGFEEEHSYHQHVYPFQLVSNEFKDANYFKNGDWHDTYMDGTHDTLIRYRPTTLPGKIMVHCHNSLHADRGMLAKEYVRDVSDGDGTTACKCNLFAAIEGDGIVDENLDHELSHGGESDQEKSNAGTGRRGLSTSIITTIVLVMYFSYDIRTFPFELLGA